MLRALATVLVLAVAPAADAKCAMMGLAPDVITPSGTTIAPDGGVVVGAADTMDDQLDEGDVASQSGWRFRIGSRSIEPVMTPLAPGLVLYKLPADAKGATLVDDKRATVGEVTVGAKSPLLAAPKIKKITYDSAQGRRPFAEVTVELDGGVPAGVLALVLADPKGKPLSWGRAKPSPQEKTGNASVRAYDRKRCHVLPNGTVESKTGDKVTAFWVDSSGRKSPASKVITIVAEKPPAPDED